MPAKAGRGGKTGARGRDSGRSGARRTARSRAPGLPHELEEEVDTFIDGRSKVMFGDEPPAGSDSDSDEIDVVGLGGNSASSDADSDDSDTAGAHDVALSEDDDNDVTKVADEDHGWWGKKKGDYYDADELEGSADEHEEEKEAIRVQKKRSAALQAEDFGDGEVVSSSEDEAQEAGQTLGDSLDGKQGKPTAKTPGSPRGRSQKKTKHAKSRHALSETTEERMLAEVDDELQALDADGALRVEKDLDGLTEKDKMKLLMNDAPELKSLMSDFTAHMKVLRGTLLPARMLALSRSAPQAGRDYLDTKIDLVVRYCSSIAFYLLLRTEGMSVKTHPVIDSLVDLRGMLDKLGPLDDKLKAQVKRLLAEDAVRAKAGRASNAKTTKDSRGQEESNARGVGAGDEDSDDASVDGEAGGDTSDGEGGSSAVSAEEEMGESEDESEDEDGTFFFPQLDAAEEVASGNEDGQEVGTTAFKAGGAKGGRSKSKAEGQRAAGVPGSGAERAEFDDEDVMDQEPEEEAVVTGKKKTSRSMSTAYVDAGDLGEGEDDNEDVDAVRVMRKRTLQGYIEQRDQARRSKKAAKDTGEKDVPVRDRGERIRHVENRKLKDKRARLGMEEEDAMREAANGGDDAEANLPPEDPYYAAVRQQQQEAHAARAQRYAHPEKTYAPQGLVDDGDKRSVGYQISKNRGLVPHRSKDKKNPRVKHRLKYEKAKTKERTSFYGKQKRDDNTGAYAGEATGIKANIARSRKLDSKDH